LKHGTGGNERTYELGGVANNSQKTEAVAGNFVVGQVMELGREVGFFPVELAMVGMDFIRETHAQAFLQQLNILSEQHLHQHTQNFGVCVCEIVCAHINSRGCNRQCRTDSSAAWGCNSDPFGWRYSRVL